MSTKKEEKVVLARLTKEQILALDDSKFEDVEVPEWKCLVRLKRLSGDERDQFEQICTSRRMGKDGSQVNVRGLKVALLQKCIVDEGGELMFTTEDVKALNEKSGKVLDDLFEAARQLNGIGEGEIEDAAKN